MQVIKGLKHSLIDDWYIKGDPGSPARLRLLSCQYVSNTIRAMIGGTFWTGLLLYLNAGDAFIGTVGIISTAMNMLQFAGPLLLEHFKKRKKMLIATRQLMWFIDIVFIGLIPLMPVPEKTKLVFAAIGVGLTNLINIFVSPGVAIWHMQTLPNRVRSGYFSLVTMTSGAMTALFTFLGGLVVDLFKARGLEYWGLMSLRLFACVLCVVECLLYMSIPEEPYPESKRGHSAKGLLTGLVKEKTYLFTVAVVFMWQVSANIPGSYFSVYLLNDLNASYKFISLISAFQVPLILVMTPVWKKVLKKVGWMRTLYLAMGIFSLQYIAMALVNSQNYKWLYTGGTLLSYFFSLGISLAFTGIPYVNMPKENQTVFFGFYQTCTYVAALIGQSVGKRFILGMGDRVTPMLGMPMCGKQLIMLLTFVCVLAGAVVVMLIQKHLERRGADT